MSEFLFGPTPHTEAIDFIKDKPVVSRQVFNQMLPELKARAFTVSGVEDMSVVQAIRDKLAELPAGVPWDQAKKDLVKNLHPWLDDEESGTLRSEARAELLLRTHGFQAYSASAERVMDRQRDVFPYCQYKSMEDARVRPTHEALDGIVLPADHEFWLTHTPPWDWGCRCMKIPLSEEDLGDVRKSDEGKNQDNRDLLDGPAAKELSATRRLVRNGVAYNVTAPAESGQPGAFTWTPGSLRIPLEGLRQQYMAKPGGAETFHGFETFAKKHDLGGGVTLWDWLKGDELPVQSFPPVAAPAEPQMTLPFAPPAKPKAEKKKAAKPLVPPQPEPVQAMVMKVPVNDRYAQKEWADAHFHPSKFGLSDLEKATASNYQGEGYEVINSVLRGEGAEAIPEQDDLPGTIPRRIQRKIDCLDAAIAKSRAPAPLTVLRGLPGYAVEDVEEGSIYSDPAFLSTSLSHFTAAQVFQEGAIMTIRVPEGASALYMDELNPSQGHEVEVLLPRGSKLRIVKKEKLNGVWHIEADLET